MNTALVPLGPRLEQADAPADRRANADFIAQLIATATRAPQTRQRRRVEPEEALAAYRALGQWPTAPGRVVCRSL